jgi:hypothetical protein
MTQPDLLALLAARVAATSQAQVSRELGYNPSTISQILSGTYPADPAKILTRVDEIYGGTTVDCPGLGEIISLGRCAEWRRKPFAATNPLRVRMFRTCRHCDRR